MIFEGKLLFILSGTSRLRDTDIYQLCLLRNLCNFVQHLKVLPLEPAVHRVILPSPPTHPLNVLVKCSMLSNAAEKNGR